MIALAMDGFRFARRLPNGLYVGKPGKRGATHRITAHYPRPRMLKDAPRGVVRVCYADPKNFVDFVGADRVAKANEWLEQRRDLAHKATPYSALATPLAQIRAKKRLLWRLQDEQQNQDNNMASKKSKAPKAPKAKTEKALNPPAEGTTCAKIWALADKLKVRHEVVTACDKLGFNRATVATQYNRWREFNGITERSPRLVRDKSKDKKPTPVKGKKAPPPPPAKKKPTKKKVAPPPPPPAATPADVAVS